MPSEFLVAGSPVTTSGGFTVSLGTEVANTVWAGPTSGVAAAPAFRALVGADLPPPSASTLGGVESLAAVAHEFLTSISTAGAVTQAQPAFADISGVAAAAQIPTPTATTIGGVESAAAVANQWINSISTAGVPALSQPGFADLSGSATLTQLPSMSANTVLGALTATTPSDLAVPSCSGTSNALTWTSGTGFGCNTISGGSGTVNSGTANDLAYYATTGAAVSELASANNGALITSASGVPSIAASTANGQLLIASGTGPPVWATLTAGSGITIATGSNTITLASSGGSGTVVRGQIAGYVLANDATTPASVLDIASGQCADSTAATYITTTATFYGSTGGAWVAGAGTSAAPVDKMGAGLTVAASTWYHVFAIINAGVADVYFDTSPTAANAPTGTTAFRRIGAVLTNASSQITAFTQQNTGAGAFIWWAAQVEQTLSVTATSRLLATLPVPTGVAVRPLARVTLASGTYLLITSPAETDVAPSGTATTSPAYDEYSSQVAELHGDYITNTAAQIGFRTVAAVAAPLNTRGWIDDRGGGQ